MAFAKFQENWFRIDGEIAENHAILVNLTASIHSLFFYKSKSESQLYFCVSTGFICFSFAKKKVS